MAVLPQVGVQAVILGMAAFNSNAKSVNAQLDQMGRSAYYLERSSRSAFGGVEASASGAMLAVRSVVGIAIGALGALVAAAEVTGMKYQQQMAFIGAVSDSTSQEINTLSDAQLELSRRSTQSASDLASASTELVKAGFDISQVTKETLKAVNDLLIASNGELKAADAALLAQVATAAFGTSVVDAANVATAAVQRSALSFTDFADAMRQGGAVAAKQGLTMHEFGAVVATVGQQIKSGSEIGTGLRMMFQRLQDPSDANIKLMQKYGISLYDASGKARPFYDVLASLEQQFGRAAIQSGKLTQAQRDQALASIFGGRAVKTISVLLDEGTASYLRMLEATNELSASDLAERMLEPTLAKLIQIKNNAIAVGTAFSQGLDPFVNKLAGDFLKFLQSIDIQKVRDFGEAVGSRLYNALSVLGTVLGTVAQAFGRFFSALGSFARTVTDALGITGSINTVLDTLGTIANNIAAIVTGNLIKALETATTKFQDWKKQIEEGNGPANDLVKFIEDKLVPAFSFAAGAMVYFLAILNTVGQAMGKMVEWVANISVAFVRAIPDVIKFIQDLAAKIGDFLQRLTQTSPFIQGAVMAFKLLVVAVDTVIAVVGLAIVAFLGIINAALNTAKVLITLAKSFVDWANTGVTAANNIIDAFAVKVVGALATFAKGAISALKGFASAIGEALGPSVTIVVNHALDSVRALLQGLGFIGGASAAMARDWLNNWTDMGAVISKVGGWILQKLNELLDRLSEIPLVGELISGARASITGFFSGVSGAAVSASNSVTNFVNNALTGLQKLGEYRLELPDFSKALEEANKAAQAARDAAAAAATARTPPIPDINTEPGAYPGEGELTAEQKKLQNLTERMAELVKDLNKDIRIETDKTARDIADAYTKAAQDIEAAVKKANDAIEQANKTAAEAVDQLNTDLAIRRDEKARRDALEQNIRDQQKAFDDEAELAEVAHQRELEDAEIVARKERQIREDTEQHRLESEARTRDAIREGEDRLFQHEQEAKEQQLQHDQEATEKALQSELDANERALQKQQDQREKALQKQQDAEQKALRETQDAREEALQKQLDAEAAARDFARDLSDIQSESAADRAAAQKEFNDDIAVGVKRSIAQARLDEKLAKIAADEEEKRAALAKRQQEAAEDLAFQEQQQAQLAALRAQFDAENEAQQAVHEAALAALRAQFEQETFNLRAENERRLTELREQQERDRQDLRDRLEQEAYQRSRDRAEEDRKYREGQEETLAKFRAEEDAKALKAKRELEDTERERRKGLEKKADEFRRGLDKLRDDFERQLEDEEYTRRVEAINKEHEARIAAAQKTLDEERTRIQTALNQQITDLRTNLDLRIKTIRENYLDRLEDIVRESEGKLQPLANDVLKDIDAGLNNMRTSLEAVNTELEAAFNTWQALAGLPSITVTPPAAARPPAATTPPSGGGGGGGGWHEPLPPSISPFAAGGTVPGLYGSPYLATVHGGEYFEGMGFNGTMMTAVRMAEAMAARGIGTGSTVTNNTNYTVNAAYGRVQPEGSIQRDLGALIALTSR